MVVPDTGIGRMSEEHMGTVIKDSDEWSFIEYMLQLTTRTSRVKLLQVWHVASPHVMNLFERRTAVSGPVCILLPPWRTPAALSFICTG